MAGGDHREFRSGPIMTEAPSKDVFTISLHQENNYPFTKPPSSIDVNLPDGCGDAEYLAWLDNALSSGLRQFEPRTDLLRRRRRSLLATTSLAA